MINIAICDDDLVFASKIEAMLLQISKKQMIKMNIEVFSDGSELWDDIAFGKNKYELLYLDIEMVRINGIEVARKIRENDADAILIYISAYDNYFIELFEVEPFRFIKNRWMIIFLKCILIKPTSGYLMMKHILNIVLIKRIIRYQ